MLYTFLPRSQSPTVQRQRNIQGHLITLKTNELCEWPNKLSGRQTAQITAQK